LIRLVSETDVVVVMTSPSGSAYMGGRCPKDTWNSTRFT